MSKFLIINADGYGFTRGINRGIEEAVEHGVITSISVNTNFDAVEELPRFVKRYPHISVGVHVNPVVGRPIADPKDIASLVNAQGEFHYHEFTQRLMHKQIDLSELAHELALQVQRVREMGIKISHLDSHQNRHLYPPYFSVFLQLLREQKIPRMRTHRHYILAERSNPHLRAVGYYLRNPSRLVTHGMARYEMWVARRQGIRMADRLLSTTTTGDKSVLPLWLQLLRNVPDGWNEVFCHPAYPDDELRRWATYVDQRRAEIDVMTSKETKQEIQRCGITLRSFHDL